jgi:hypothetical protein
MLLENSMITKQILTETARRVNSVPRTSIPLIYIDSILSETGRVPGQFPSKCNVFTHYSPEPYDSTRTVYSAKSIVVTNDSYRSHEIHHMFVAKGESGMQILVFVLSIIGFGLEVAAFLMTAGVL